MIITKNVNILITKKNLEYYKNLGYDTELKNIINIKISDLQKGSNKIIVVKCDICGNERNLKYGYYIKNILKNKKYYCNKCKFILTKETNLKKYGTEYSITSNDVQKKIKKTIKEKYGVENISQINSVKRKIKKTNLDKYGVDNPMKSDIIKQKKIDNIFKKYGVSNVFQMDSVKEKLKNTNLEKYGEEYNINSNFIKRKIKNTINKNTLKKYKKYNILSINNDNKKYTFKCDCGENHNFDINIDLFYNRKQINTKLCTICNSVSSQNSGLEIQLQEFIKDNYNNIILNDRHLGKELDIYIPDLKLALEFNGLYWHNELHKENDYHLKKTELCEEKGIQLIHIYEDDWLYKQNIVKSMILNKLNKSTNRIYARKTKVREINDNKLVRKFLDENHRQGFVGSSVKLGLFFDNELVSLMILGKRRIVMGKKGSQEGDYELLRFCSKLNTNVIGGANKLFKYFIRNYEPKEITTYADRSWSQGGIYKQLGFEYQGKTKPNYYYIIDGIRNYRFNFRKDKIVKEGFDSNKTERQIMLDRKIYRIYDSGNLIYKKIVENG